MSVQEFLGVLAGLVGVLFVVSSMLAMGLGTAQRNVAAAIEVTAQNFSDSNTLSFVLVGAIILLLILLPTARRLGKSAESEESPLAAA